MKRTGEEETVKVGEASLSMARRPKDPEEEEKEKGEDKEETPPTIQCGITFPNDLIPLALRLEEVQVWRHGAVWKK